MPNPNVQVSPLAKERFFDANGIPLAGGKLFTYAAGTTNKQNSYTDSTGGTPNTNPVILDSGGYCDLWLDQTLTYKLTLSPSTDTDPPTNPIWTVDHLNGPNSAQMVALAAAGGAALVGFSQSPAAAADTVAAKLQQINSPADAPYNANAAGGADAAAAIRSAVAAAYPTKITRGNYQIGSAIVLPPWAELKGDGISSTVTASTDPVQSTRLIATAPVSLISNTSATDGIIHVEDLTLLGGVNGAHTGTHGLDISAVSYSVAENVTAQLFSGHGLQYTGAINPTLVNCRSGNNTQYGLALLYGPFQAGNIGCNMAVVRGGYYGPLNDCGIYADTSLNGLRITGAVIESNYNVGGYGIWTKNNVTAVSIEGNYFEDNLVHVVIGDPALASTVTVPQNVSISNNYFNGQHAGGTYAIELYTGNNIVIENNQFPYSSTTPALIHLHELVTANPVIKNNSGMVQVVDASGGYVAIDSYSTANTFNDPNITNAAVWTLTNCTAAAATGETCPSNNVPVYLVSNSTTGFTRLSYTQARASFTLTNHNTIGFWFKSFDQNSHYINVTIATTIGPTYFTDVTVDTVVATKGWQWISLGKNIPTSYTGDIQVTIDSQAGSYYISDIRATPGICYKPYTLNPNQVDTLVNGATPSVYGMQAAYTGGTTEITSLLNGATGQVFEICSLHAITITNGGNLKLAGAVNFVMKPGDSLTLRLWSDGFWHEKCRSVN